MYTILNRQSVIPYSRLFLVEQILFKNYGINFGTHDVHVLRESNFYEVVTCT